MLAVDEINAGGGINGHKVEVVIEDEATILLGWQKSHKNSSLAMQSPLSSAGPMTVPHKSWRRWLNRPRFRLSFPLPNGDQITKGHQWSFQVDVASTTFVQKIVSTATQKTRRWDHLRQQRIWQADRDFALADLKELNIKRVAVLPISDVRRDYTPQLKQFRTREPMSLSPLSAEQTARLRKDGVRLGYQPPSWGKKAELSNHD